MYKVHGYFDDQRIINSRMEHLPRVGDTIRVDIFGEVRYGTVTEIIWCMDEDSDYQRVNIRIESSRK